jgi:DNA replication initiation complex subunit (GINS family)
MHSQMLAIAKKWNLTARKIKELTEAQKALSEQRNSMVDSTDGRLAAPQTQTIVKNRTKTEPKTQPPIKVQPQVSPSKTAAAPKPAKTVMPPPIPPEKIRAEIPRSSSSSIPIMVIPSGKSQGIRWRLPRITQE